MNSDSGRTQSTVGPARIRIERMLRPKTIAIVGLSDRSIYAPSLRINFESDAEVIVVNPNHATVYGRPTVKSLTDVGRPVDCVMSLLGADRAVELAEEASRLDIGGLMVLAAGFAEFGVVGQVREERLRAAAREGGFALMGPNALGFENVPRRIRLTGAVEEEHNVGGISIVSHSGAMTSGVTMAGNASGAGFNLLISAGNEAVIGMADYIDYLVDDPLTKAIGLVLEVVREPTAFFASVRRAVKAGKPVVALKLARTERTRRIAASHTAALAGDAWAYEIAFRQHGIAIARDPEELIDRLAIIGQIAPDRWSAVRSLGVVVMTGGFAGLSYDIAVDEGLNVPAAEELLPWVRERVVSATVPNPLDITGLAMGHWREILEHYMESDAFDAFFVTQPMTVDDDLTRSIVIDICESAERISKPVVLANSSGMPPNWVKKYRGSGTAAGHGVRASMRGLKSLGQFVKFRTASRPPVEVGRQIGRPETTPVALGEGAMLPFGAAMELLKDFAIPVAPYAVVDDRREADIGFDEPYAVKLADVAHRTELGAVRLNVLRRDLRQAVRELRVLADKHGLPRSIVVQPMLPSLGEALIGIQGDSELGPLVVFGLGGTLVEAVRRISGRLAPFDELEARDLIDEFTDVQLIHGFRGRSAWDLDELARILTRVSSFAAATRGWIGSLDLNPVIYGPQGYFAVDALVLVRPE